MSRILVCVVVLLLAAECSAQSFCFLSASSYYEQVYCELQARGEARGLPPFYQFKRNDETIQATLLRRPAARIGIDLPTPKKTEVTLPEVATLPSRSVQTKTSQSATSLPATLSTETSSAGCYLRENIIDCGDSRFQLVGNRLNHRLEQDALTSSNRMDLPSFNGNAQEQQAVNLYLSRAYGQYIDRMHAIGLAGATLSYSKFVFLFYDLQEKGLDFSQRFETMYNFLKKDKASMGVSEALNPDASLSLDDCAPLPQSFWVCQKAGRNFVFAAQH